MRAHFALGRACGAAAIAMVLAVAVALAKEPSSGGTPWKFRAAPATLVPRDDFHPRIVRQLTFGGPGRDDAYDVWPFAGGWVVTGSAEDSVTHDLDLVVLRLDSKGDALWARTYGGSERDIGFAVRALGEDRIVVAGWTKSRGAGEGDFYLLGLDATGAVLFDRTFGTKAEERATALTVTRDGGILVLGESYGSSTGDSRFYAVKTDSQGRTLWERTYDDGPLNERGLAIVELDDGFALVGNSMDTTSGSTAKRSDGLVVRVDATGQERWRRRIGTDVHDILHHAVRLTDGRLLLTGYSRHARAVGLNDVWLVTLDGDGNTVGEWFIEAVGENHNIIARASDNGIVLGGYTRASNQWDVQLLRLAPTALYFSQTFDYGTPGDDGCVSLWPLPAGIVVVGYTTNPAGNRDMLWMRLQGQP